MLTDARPQARKNRRRIRWNTLRIFLGRERRRWQQIVCRSRMALLGQTPERGSGSCPEPYEDKPAISISNAGFVLT